MFVSQASALRRDNAGLHAQMTALSTKAGEENRQLTSEEREQWDRMDGEYIGRLVTIVDHEKLEKRERENNALDPSQHGRENTGSEGEEEEDPIPPDSERRDVRGHIVSIARWKKNRSISRALRSFITQAPAEWSDEDRVVIQNRLGQIPKAEARALGLTGSAGGFTIPEDFMVELDRAMLSFSGIAQAARMVPTEGGADMPWPTVNDSGNSGALLAEGGAAADTPDPLFAAVTLQAFVYTSKILRVANQLLQDTAFPLEAELALMLGERLGRIMNTHGTTGDGSSKPRGIVTAVLADTTPETAASATAIAYNDLLDLQHAVDPEYRNRPKTAWMFHDLILKAIKKLVDGDGRPLWSSGIAVREPETLLGKPFFINQAMDSVIQEDAETILFGDFSKYVIRRVGTPVLTVLRERYAEFFQTAIVMFDRWDSDLVDSGTGPIKVLDHNLV